MLNGELLYSVILELSALYDAVLLRTTGRLAYAMFFTLIKQFDEALSACLQEPGYHPFTLSQLYETQGQGKRFILKQDQLYHLRLTLLDGGPIWNGLSTYFLEAGPITVRLGPAVLQLRRMISSPSEGCSRGGSKVSWQQLVSLPPQHIVRFHFLSPTTFSLGERKFALAPKPPLLWKSLLHVWNTYAPTPYRFEKHGLSDALKQVRVVQCALRIRTLHFRQYIQKGFIGTCTYALPLNETSAPLLTTLAAFAPYAGVGHKTTQGMGQVEVTFEHTLEIKDVSP